MILDPTRGVEIVTRHVTIEIDLDLVIGLVASIVKAVGIAEGRKNKYRFILYSFYFRSYSRSSSPPSRRYDDSPPTSSSAIFSSPHSKNEALSSFILGADFSGDSSTMGASLPEEVKKDLCVKDWDPNKMSGAAIRWVAEQVAEQASCGDYNYIKKEPLTHKFSKHLAAVNSIRLNVQPTVSTRR
jgi:hypothetical protein